MDNKVTIEQGSLIQAYKVASEEQKKNKEFSHE